MFKLKGYILPFTALMLLLSMGALLWAQERLLTLNVFLSNLHQKKRDLDLFHSIPLNDFKHFPKLGCVDIEPLHQNLKNNKHCEVKFSGQTFVYHWIDLGSSLKVCVKMDSRLMATRHFQLDLKSNLTGQQGVSIYFIEVDKTPCKKPLIEVMPGIRTWHHFEDPKS